MFEIDDYDELLALHKLLMERHYKIEFHCDEIVGSSFISNISNRVVECLIKMNEDKGDYEAVELWKQWRNLDDSQQEWSMLLSRIACIGEVWRTFSTEEKKGCVLYLLSPFTVSLDQLDGLLDYGDRNNGRN